MIRAEVHSDDFRYEIDFDATEFFEQASSDELIELAESGWGGSEAADRIIYFMEDRNKRIQAMMEYLQFPTTRAKEIGFECYVSKEDAVKWLEKKDPRLAMAIKKGWKGFGPRDWAP